MPISKLPPDPGWCGNPSRGASMGRGSHSPADPETPRKFYLVRVPINSGGYDSGGSYWGTGTPLYRYESADGEADGYLRGITREAAKAAIREDYPSAEFFR